MTTVEIKKVNATGEFLVIKCRAGFPRLLKKYKQLSTAIRFAESRGWNVIHHNYPKEEREIMATATATKPKAKKDAAKDKSVPARLLRAVASKTHDRESLQKTLDTNYFGRVLHNLVADGAIKDANGKYSITAHGKTVLESRTWNESFTRGAKKAAKKK